jgi:predicted dehydrogenase
VRGEADEEDFMTIRVGVIGAGANTVRWHIPRLQRIDGVAVSAVVNRGPESSQRVARQFGIPRVHARWQDLVADPALDAVVIGTWPYLHARATIAALRAGKHVLCEARMAMDVAEALAMRDVARECEPLVTQIVPAPFSLPVDATIVRLLAEGYCGELLAVDVQDGGGFIQPDAPLHWRHDADLCGVNVMSLGIWYETLMRWVGEATHVVARGRTFVRQRRDAAGTLRAVRLPDHLDVLADLACGAQAHLRISAVQGHAGPPSATLYGSAGTLRFVDGVLLGGRRADAALAPISVPPHEAGAWRVEESFIGAIRGSEPVRLTDVDTGVKYMRFTEAVARSVASGMAVALER